MQNKDVPKGLHIAGIFTPQVLMRAAVLFSLCFTLFLLHLPFYGDQATLVSAPAQYYYDNGFRSFWLPEHLATGHPPLYPMLVAGLWLIFGKSLAIVHLLSLVCVVFLLTQAYALIRRSMPERAGTLGMLLILCYPVLWAQTAGMSVDVLLSGLVLFAFRMEMAQKRRALSLALAILPFLSLRGWIWLLALGLYSLWQPALRTRFTRLLSIWIPALVPILLYIFWQHKTLGWWLVPADNNWSEHRAWVSPIGFAGKSFEFTLRMLEFGMLLPFCYWLWHLCMEGLREGFSAMDKAILVSIFAVLLLTLPFQGPIVIRYILPLQLLILIASAERFLRHPAPRGAIRSVALACTLLWMIGSHFFAYPQMERSLFEYSWADGSLAHLGYFSQRAEAQAYLQEQGISRNQVHSAFPETKSFALTDLSNDRTACITLDTLQLATTEWVLYSNVMNMIDKRTERWLSAHYRVEQRWDAWPVHMVLYQRKPASGQP